MVLIRGPQARPWARLATPIICSTQRVDVPTRVVGQAHGPAEPDAIRTSDGRGRRRSDGRRECPVLASDPVPETKGALQLEDGLESVAQVLAARDAPPAEAEVVAGEGEAMIRSAAGRPGSC